MRSLVIISVPLKPQSPPPPSLEFLVRNHGWMVQRSHTWIYSAVRNVDPGVPRSIRGLAMRNCVSFSFLNTEFLLIFRRSASQWIRSSLVRPVKTKLSLLWECNLARFDQCTPAILPRVWPEHLFFYGGAWFDMELLLSPSSERITK